MAYQSLYRKYRSRDFTDLMGQHHITQTLANAISSGRVAHAYLFCGPRGTGKTSTARVLAKALNCEHGPTVTPCDVCANCLAIRQGSALDVIEIDAASNRNIDDMRQLREQVNYPPVSLNYKFYIVDEVHQLTRDAFNAFLKTLEEPPERVVFVLCTTDPHQLPATILSRCQRFDFHRITQDDIVTRLRWVVEQEGWTVENEAIQLLARAANGGLRDALSLLDQAASYAGTEITAQHVRDILGGIDLDLLLRYSDLVLRKDAEGLFGLIEGIIAEGKDVPQMVAELILHWRNLLRTAIGGADVLVELSPEQRALLAQQAKRSTQAAIMRAIMLLCEAENELRWNTQQRLLLELYSLRIMGEEAPVVAAAPVVQAPAPRPAPQPVAPPRDAVAPPREYVAPTPPPVRAQAAPPPTPPQAAPRPQPSAVYEPAAAPVTDTPSGADNSWTLPRVKSAWPQFIEWMRRSAKLDNLRERIVEKCQPAGLIGTTLTLATPSGFVRDQVKERPQVKSTLEQCLQSYFKTALNIAVELQTEPVTEPVIPVSPSAPPPPPAAEPVTEQPDRDIIQDRMQQVFPGGQEIVD